MARQQQKYSRALEAERTKSRHFEGSRKGSVGGGSSVAGLSVSTAESEYGFGFPQNVGQSNKISQPIKAGKQATTTAAISSHESGFDEALFRLQARNAALQQQIHSMPPSLVVAQAEKRVLESKLEKAMHDSATREKHMSVEMESRVSEMRSVLESLEKEKSDLREKNHSKTRAIQELTHHIQILESRMQPRIPAIASGSPVRNQMEVRHQNQEMGESHWYVQPNAATDYHGAPHAAGEMDLVSDTGSLLEPHYNDVRYLVHQSDPNHNYLPIGAPSHQHRRTVSDLSVEVDPNAMASHAMYNQNYSQADSDRRSQSPSHGPNMMDANQMAAFRASHDGQHMTSSSPLGMRQTLEPPFQATSPAAFGSHPQGRVSSNRLPSPLFGGMPYSQTQSFAVPTPTATQNVQPGSFAESPLAASSMQAPLPWSNGISVYTTVGMSDVVSGLTGSGFSRPSGTANNQFLDLQNSTRENEHMFEQLQRSLQK